MKTKTVDFLLTTLVGYLEKFARDIYLPALPILVGIFGVTQHQVQFSVALFFYALCLGRLFWPILLERYDLGIIIHCTFALFCVATMLSLFWIDITVFNMMRFIQGFTMGMMPTIFRGYVYHNQLGNKTIQVLSFSSVLTAWASAVAVGLGGFLVVTIGWLAVSVALIIIAIVSWIYIINSIVVHPSSRQSTPFAEILGQLTKICLRKEFLLYTIPFSLLNAGLSAYLTMSPFLFTDQFFLTPELFSVVSVIIFSGLMVGKVLLGLMIEKYNDIKIIWVGLLVCCLSVFGMFFSADHLILLTTMLFFYMGGYGLLILVCKTNVMNHSEGLIYSSTAMVGVISGLLGALTSSLIAYFGWSHVSELSVVLGTLSAASILIFALLKPNNSTII